MSACKVSNFNENFYEMGTAHFKMHPFELKFNPCQQPFIRISCSIRFTAVLEGMSLSFLICCRFYSLCLRAGAEGVCTVYILCAISIQQHCDLSIIACMEGILHPCCLGGRSGDAISETAGTLSAISLSIIDTEQSELLDQQAWTFAAGNKAVYNVKLQHSLTE